VAFNKQPMQAADVGGWRQRSKSRDIAKKATFRSGGFVGSRFSGIFKPPLQGTALLRVVPGQYKVARAVKMTDGKYGLQTENLEYYECVEHYDGRTKKSTICSAGPIWFRKQYAQDCIPCKAYWNSPTNDKGRRAGRFSRRDLFVFTVLVYGPFIQVEQTDYRTGLVKLSEKTGKAYTEWVPKQPGLIALQEKEGHIMHWPVGYGHMQVIQGYDKLIGQTCSHCHTRDGIRRRALLCAKCGTDIVDCVSTNVQLAQQEKMLEEDTRCTHCGHDAPLQEFIECITCSQPVRASLFDVDITVQAMETTGQRQLIVTQWSDPHPIDASYKAKPLNLPGMYQPDTLETQENRFGLSLSEADEIGGGGEATEEEAQQYTRPYRQ
jgi:hypothetical protein